MYSETGNEKRRQMRPIQTCVRRICVFDCDLASQIDMYIHIQHEKETRDTDKQRHHAKRVRLRPRWEYKLIRYSGVLTSHIEEDWIIRKTFDPRDPMGEADIMPVLIQSRYINYQVATLRSQRGRCWTRSRECWVTNSPVKTYTCAYTSPVYMWKCTIKHDQQIAMELLGCPQLGLVNIINVVPLMASGATAMNPSDPHKFLLSIYGQSSIKGIQILNEYHNLSSLSAQLIVSRLRPMQPKLLVFTTHDYAQCTSCLSFVRTLCR